MNVTVAEVLAEMTDTLAPVLAGVEWLMPSLTLTLAVVLAVATWAPLGVREDSPILTEDERVLASTTITSL